MISPDDIRHLAKLSRLRVEDEDIPSITEKLESILGYVAAVQAVDTTGVPELVYPVAMENAMRDDVADATLPEQRDVLISKFPRRAGDLNQVPAVFERRDD